MNIGEIAKRAQVSTATVSRTINGSEKVSPETAKRVWKVVHSMGYHPSSYARALVSGRSRVLGLIISDILNPFFPELVKSFEDIAFKNGLDVIVADTGYDPERTSLNLRRMIERKVEGVAVMTSEMDEDFIAQLQTRGIPIVFLDTGKVGQRTSNIRVDYGKGIGEAVNHLVQLGHRRIGFITGSLEYSSSIERREAFIRSLHSYGLPRSRGLIQTGNFKIDGGEAAMERLLHLDVRPTAVIASNDLSAIGALRAIHRAGLRVPEDISLVGFDDIDFSQMTQPPLTTVRLPRKDLAEKAFDALNTIIDSKSQIGRQYAVETHLVVRESTARLSEEHKRSGDSLA
jgi:DNA-binding LacI/PurR family transcriptional regulator